MEKYDKNGVKNSLNLSRVEYDKYGYKIWRDVKQLGYRLTKIIRTKPSNFYSKYYAPANPTETWVHDNVRMLMR